MSYDLSDYVDFSKLDRPPKRDFGYWVDGEEVTWGTGETMTDFAKLWTEAEKEFRATADNVNHPSHYNESGIECIEAIRASLGDEFPAYCKGNVMKYLWRYKYKNGLEDLKKAQVYLNWMIEHLDDKE